MAIIPCFDTTYSDVKPVSFKNVFNKFKIISVINSKFEMIFSNSTLKRSLKCICFLVFVVISGLNINSVEGGENKI